MNMITIKHAKYKCLFMTFNYKQLFMPKHYALSSTIGIHCFTHDLNSPGSITIAYALVIRDIKLVNVAVTEPMRKLFGP